jgi:hypothetical protein
VTGMPPPQLLMSSPCAGHAVEPAALRTRWRRAFDSKVAQGSQTLWLLPRGGPQQELERAPAGVGTPIFRWSVRPAG